MSSLLYEFNSRQFSFSLLNVFFFFLRFRYINSKLVFAKLQEITSFFSMVLGSNWTWQLCGNKTKRNWNAVGVKNGKFLFLKVRLINHRLFFSKTSICLLWHSDLSGNWSHLHSNDMQTCKVANVFLFLFVVSLHRNSISWQELKAITK